MRRRDSLSEMDATQTVRRAGAADAAALAAFAARTFAETFGPDNRPDDMAAHLALAYGPAQQGRELADPAYATLLIEDAGTLIAYAQVRRHDPPACVTGSAPIELHRFYVDRAWHGRGVARRLMAEVRIAAAQFAALTLWLSVWERNPRAIAFYAKCGFADVGSTSFYVGPDCQTDRVMVASID
jgi:GNAT superfamily N-acetyltransferase